MTAATDQVDAAERHARRIAETLARRTGKRLVDVTNHPAVARIVRELRGRVALGVIGGCPHSGSPRPLWWRAWRPDELACTTCALAARDPIASTAEDHRCDSCGAVDPEHGRAGIVRAGPVLVVVGLCRDCLGGAV